MSEGRTRFTRAGVKLLLLIVACACAGVVLAVPRPAKLPPLPQLTFSPREIASATSRSHANAARVSGRRSRALWTAYRAYNTAQADRSEPQHVAIDRKNALRSMANELREFRGDPALFALRGQALVDYDNTERMDVDDQKATVGGFFRQLAQFKLDTAPAFVVRTAFLARWNTIHGLPADSGMSGAEQRAFHGWRLLHLPAQSAEQEAAAIALTGFRQEELDTVGAVAISGLRPAQAVAAFDRLYERTGNVRYRNHAIGLMAR